MSQVLGALGIAFLMVAGSLGLVVAWRVRSGVPWRWFAAGAAVWVVGVGAKFVVAALAYQPVIDGLKAAAPVWVAAPVGGLWGGLFTGVFEGGATLAAALLWRGWARDPPRAVAIGLGAGTVEACVLAGVVAVGGALSALADVAPPADPDALGWLVAPVERALATLVHASSRVLILRSVAARRPSPFWAGFLVLTGIDAVAGAFDVAGLVGRISTWWIELAIAPFAVASVPVLAWAARSWPAPGEPAPAASAGSGRD